MRYGNRYQFGLILLTGFFVLATLFAVLLYVVTPATPVTRGPLFLTVFVAVLLGTLVAILFFLRWLLRPYRQLVGEAERASIQSGPSQTRDEAEFVLETFQSVVSQLQEQRKALELLSAQASQRADSAERFNDRIVASVPSGLVAFDGDGKSMVINAPARSLLGVQAATAGQPAGEILKNVPQLAEMVQQCLSSGQIYRREEVETFTPEKLPRRLGATVAPIDLQTSQGERGALCLITDLTEVTHLREQLALKKNLESLGEMSAGLAHEFKNALATLQGYVQLLQSQELDAESNRTAASLLGEVRNLSELVTSFLNFARPQPLQLDEVDLNELIENCVVELKPLFLDREIDLSIEHPQAVSQPPETLRADERMLRQAMLNLIRNAAEAIPEGKLDGRVELTTEQENDWWLVEIKDTGEGIPPSDLERIFIPFFTTKASGHGVGLALAHRVITQHGGTLTAANSPEGGAIFTVRLPKTLLTAEHGNTDSTSLRSGRAE